MKKQYNAPVARAIKFDYERVVAESKCDALNQFRQDGTGCTGILQDQPYMRSYEGCVVYNQ